MATKHDLKHWIIDALRVHDGSAPLAEVAKHIWDRHEEELRRSGSFFYTWQYDMRWAATELRKEGRMLPSQGRKWRLARNA